MEITEHQANMFRALADRKTLQACQVEPADDAPFDGKWFNLETLDSALLYLTAKDYYVRIKPEVIIVNGIEVPAPAKQELPEGTRYWVASPTDDDGCSGGFSWGGGDTDKKWLRYDIVHLSREAAGAHGKAMRVHKQG